MLCSVPIRLERDNTGGMADLRQMKTSAVSQVTMSSLRSPTLSLGDDSPKSVSSNIESGTPELGPYGPKKRLGVNHLEIGGSVTSDSRTMISVQCGTLVKLGVVLWIVPWLLIYAVATGEGFITGRKFYLSTAMNQGTGRVLGSVFMPVHGISFFIVSQIAAAIAPDQNSRSVRIMRISSVIGCIAFFCIGSIGYAISTPGHFTIAALAFGSLMTFMLTHSMSIRRQKRGSRLAQLQYFLAGLCLALLITLVPVYAMHYKVAASTIEVLVASLQVAYLVSLIYDVNDAFVELRIVRPPR